MKRKNGFSFMLALLAMALAGAELVSNAFAQSLVSQEWASYYNYNYIRTSSNSQYRSSDRAADIAVSSEGNCYVTGISYTYNTFNDIVTVKYDSLGNEKWSQRYHNVNDDLPAAIMLDENENVYVVGYSYSYSGRYNIIILKYSSSGTLLRVSPEYNGPGNNDDFPWAIERDSQGNIYVVGITRSANTYDIVLIKYDDSLNYINSVTYDHGSSVAYGLAMHIDDFDNILITGTIKQSYYTVITLGYDTNLSRTWTTTGVSLTYSFKHYFGYGITTDSNGNVYVTGIGANPYGGQYQQLLIKYSPDGTRLWTTYTGVEAYQYFQYSYGQAPNVEGKPYFPIVVDSNDDILIAATGRVLYPNGQDYIVAKYDSSGTSVWSSPAYYNGPVGGGNDYLRDMILDGSNNIYLTGYCYGGYWTRNDYVTVKLDADGAFIWHMAFNGPASSDDLAMSLGMDNNLNVYVTGFGRVGGTDDDFETVKYHQEITQQTGSIAGKVKMELGYEYLDLQGGRTIALYELGATAPVFITASDDTGGFSFAGLTPGIYEVYLQELPEGFVVSPDPYYAIVSAGNEYEVEFTITPLTGTITGRITDNESGEGIAGVTLTLDSDPVTTMLSDALGYYSFTDLDEGDYTVAITEPDGYTTYPEDDYVVIPLSFGQTVVTNFALNPYASVTGCVIHSELDTPVEGITLMLSDLMTSYTASTDAEGSYTFQNLFEGDYTLAITLPDGYELETDYSNSVPVYPIWGVDWIEDFVIKDLPVNLDVYVSNGSDPYAGVTVDVTYYWEGNKQEPILYTDDTGHCFLNNLPGNRDYTVEMVLPLGFVTSNDRYEEERMGGIDWYCPFQIDAGQVVNEARSKGYWKHQVKVNSTGNGSCDYDEEELSGVGGFTEEIYDHFYGNWMAPVLSDGVTNVDDVSMTLNDLNETLNSNQNGGGVFNQAKQQLLALLLNVVSGKLSQTWPASPDATVAQAIAYISQLMIEGTEEYDPELAKDIAETLNQGEEVAEGIILYDEPIVYNGGSQNLIKVESYCFSHPTPNPFNPSTTMRVSLPDAAYVKLCVYNVNGSLVATLIDGWKEEGIHDAQFDGSRLASGVYLYHLQAGEHNEVGRMVLLK